MSPFIHIFAIKTLFAAELKDPKIVISGKKLIKTFVNVFNFIFRMSWWAVHHTDYEI